MWRSANRGLNASGAILLSSSFVLSISFCAKFGLQYFLIPTCVKPQTVIRYKQVPITRLQTWASQDFSNVQHLKRITIESESEKCFLIRIRKVFVSQKPKGVSLPEFENRFSIRIRKELHKQIPKNVSQPEFEKCFSIRNRKAFLNQNSKSASQSETERRFSTRIRKVLLNQKPKGVSQPETEKCFSTKILKYSSISNRVVLYFA